MNPWQVTQQLVWLFNKTNFVWPDSPGNPVFGRVGVSPLDPNFFDLDSSNPTLLVRPQAAQHNPEHPEIIENANWEVAILGVVGTDQAGGASTVGGNRASLGSSAGRGVQEIEGLVERQIRLGMIGCGVRPLVRAVTGASAVELPGLVCLRAYDVAATRPLQTQPDYQAVSRLSGTGGAGSVTLAWNLPSKGMIAGLYRWDLVGTTVRRAAGSTAPSSPTAGTGVPVTGLATGVVDTPGPGTWSYAVFGTYDAGRDPISGSQPTSPLSRYGESATITVTA